MSEFCNGFGALPQGFSAVSMDELAQIEGGLFGITWDDVKAAAKFVVTAAVTVLVGKAVNKL